MVIKVSNTRNLARVEEPKPKPKKEKIEIIDPKDLPT